MSTEAWISVTGILVTLALTGASGVFGIGGWFLSGMLKERDRKISKLEKEIEAIKQSKAHEATEIAVIKTILRGRGYLPPSRRDFPSPPPHSQEEITE